jgi:hypothetical protein
MVFIGLSSIPKVFTFVMLILPAPARPEEAGV